MDPLTHNVPDLHDFLLQHFTAGDFREITKVSPSWNEIIEKSPAMMRNVALHFDTSDIEGMIKNLSRCYRNVEVMLQFDVSERKIDEIFEYIRVTSPKLLSLEMWSIHRGNANEYIIDTFDLSKLKVLILSHFTEGVTSKILHRCHSLEKLELRGLRQNYDRSPLFDPSFMSCLERNRCLKYFTLLGTQSFKMFFDRDISKIFDFRLRRFEVTNLNINEIPANIEENFTKFLTRQAQSLEHLNIDACTSNVIEHVFNKMSALISLKIGLKYKYEHFASI